MPTWEPERYLQFAAERGRPFADLLARVGARAPRTVVDLGCGPGNLTRTLAGRWPGARVTGLDSSAAMVAAATAAGDGRVRFEVADAVDWQPGGAVDVVVANALLQWVPGCLQLVGGWLTGLAPGGWLAVQVPGNFDAPAHRAIAAVAAEEPFAAALAAAPEGVERLGSPEPRAWLAALVRAGERCPGGAVVDVWETTYLHVLPGRDPVLDWVLGTGARPVVEVLARVDRGLADRYVEVLRHRLAAAHPPGPGGTVLPFRRIFAVAARADRP